MISILPTCCIQNLPEAPTRNAQKQIVFRLSSKNETPFLQPFPIRRKKPKITVMKCPYIPGGKKHHISCFFKIGDKCVFYTTYSKEVKRKVRKNRYFLSPFGHPTPFFVILIQLQLVSTIFFAQDF
jgi:hypothetical protein